jgi:predicted MFS family arabinose efflux permease
VLLMMLGTTLGWGGFQAYFPLLARRTLGYSPTQVGVLLALAAVANGAARTAGPVYDAVRRKGLIVCGVLFGFAAGLVLIPDTGQFWETALLLVLAVGCLGLGFVGAATVFTYIAPQEVRSQVMGLFTSLQFLGVAASPAIVAPAMDHSLTLGFELMGLIVAVVAALAAVPALLG